MRALRAKFVSLRDLLATAWPIVLVSAVALYVAYQFVEPAPPKRMVVSTGSEDGAYHAFATRYAELLAHNGIELEIRSSSGSKGGTGPEALPKETIVPRTRRLSIEAMKVSLPTPS